MYPEASTERTEKKKNGQNVTGKNRRKRLERLQESRRRRSEGMSGNRRRREKRIKRPPGNRKSGKKERQTER